MKLTTLSIDKLLQRQAVMKEAARQLRGIVPRRGTERDKIALARQVDTELIAIHAELARRTMEAR